ncbi:hypothetical protein MAR_010367 [Mya arenaria]|uniref:Secreted protein n=1 Tax=Mya arenaria TaxID=6604 RepID=A0ABY7E3L8_MYAAR|nr:hypothetical protein MAR_010367 [Mya arenaria]
MVQKLFFHVIICVLYVDILQFIFNVIERFHVIKLCSKFLLCFLDWENNKTNNCQILVLFLHKVVTNRCLLRASTGILDGVSIWAPDVLISTYR